MASSAHLLYLHPNPPLTYPQPGLHLRHSLQVILPSAMASPSTDSHVDDSSPLENYNMNGKIIVSSLGLLCFIVFIVVVMHLYARWCWSRSNTRQHALLRLRSSFPSFQRSSKASGLDKEIVEALPIFTYMPPLYKGDNLGANKAAECAVCLAEFRQDESCKLLPKCKHFFHVGCIDKWFLSHATCPLCRATPGSFLVDEEAGYAQGHFTTHVDGEYGEQVQEAQRGLWCAHEAGDYDAPLHTTASLQPRKWRRSFSDRFPYTEEAVLSSDEYGYNHVRIALMEERSLAHVGTDKLRRQKSLVGVSSCPSIPSLVSPRWLSQHPNVYPPIIKEPKFSTRVLGKYKKGGPRHWEE